MNHLKRFSGQVSSRVFSATFLPGFIGLVIYIVMQQLVKTDWIVSALVAGAWLILSSTLAYSKLMNTVMRPISMVWQAVWHVSPERSDVPPPKLEDIRIGREMVNALISQIYDLASSGHGLAAAPVTSNNPSPQPNPQPASDDVLESIPQPLFLLDKDRVIRVANQSASAFLGLPKEKIIGSSVTDILQMSFTSTDTLEAWLDGVATTRATDQKTWEHVRINLADNKTSKQFDLSASYSRDKSNGLETTLALFDRTKTYNQQDHATSYVALAVHELRTPLTILRGYIEVFEDELGDQLTPELREFMRKMSASAQSLTAFVSNILNVARIDENQFVLNLHEGDWATALPEIIKDLEIRASVRNKKLELVIDPNLPKVAIDRISMYEVVSNLVDNAIKYSGQADKITIHAYLEKDGTVSTTVQDYGVGIPSSVMDGLFTRFYRSHRSKNAVSGSGLGLYLVKSIITAHGGNVWVQSKEGEGSTFGFSLQPFSNIGTAKAKDQEGIERQASGWIKNHSMYRR